VVEGGGPEEGRAALPDRMGLGRGLAVGLVLAVVVYGAFVFYTDLDALREGLRRLRWEAFALACGLSLGNYVLRWARWQRYLGALDVPLGVGRSVGVFGSGFVLTLSPGKVAELYKVALLRRHSPRPPEVATGVAVVMAERLTDLVGMAILFGVGLGVFPGAWPIAVGALAALAFALVALTSSRLRARLVGWLRGGRTERLAVLLDGVFGSLGTLLRPRWLLEGSVLATLAWVLQAGALAILVADLGGEGMTLVEASFTYSSATLGGVATFLPGGLGATELGLAALVSRFAELSPELASLAAILVRAATLWFAVLLGGLAWAALPKAPQPKAPQPKAPVGPQRSK